MTNKEIRDLTNEQIVKKIEKDTLKNNIEDVIEESKEELFNLRFKQATGTLEKPARLNELRKDVARMKTILKEREING